MIKSLSDIIFNNYWNNNGQNSKEQMKNRKEDKIHEI